MPLVNLLMECVGGPCDGAIVDRKDVAKMINSQVREGDEIWHYKRGSAVRHLYLVMTVNGAQRLVFGGTKPAECTGK